MEAARTMKNAGFECYLVGGCVRDLLLGRSVKDLDLTSNAHPEQSRKLFKKTIPTGIEHGTITVRLFGQSLELTTYRTEGTYSDGRRPDQVAFGQSLSEDLCRRDFTVNALAYDPISGDLIDEHGGLQDLEDGLIRTIGAPRDRFYEDGLRPIRACRFLSTLGFSLEAVTEKAISEPDVQDRTALVAIERFTDELRKGFKSPDPSLMLEKLRTSGLLRIFLNRAQMEVSVESVRTESLLHGREAQLERFKDRIQGLEDGMDWFVDIRIFLWLRSGLPDLSPEQAGMLLRRWKFPNHTISCFQGCQRLLQSAQKLAAADGEMAPGSLSIEEGSIPQMREDAHTGFEIRSTLFDLEKLLSHRLHSFLNVWKVALEEFPSPLPGILFTKRMQQFVQSYENEPFRIKDLAIGGKDLMERGITGKEVGDKLLLCLETVWQEPTRNSREGLLALVSHT